MLRDFQEIQGGDIVGGRFRKRVLETIPAPELPDLDLDFGVVSPSKSSNANLDVTAIGATLLLDLPLSEAAGEKEKPGMAERAEESHQDQDQPSVVEPPRIEAFARPADPEPERKPIQSRSGTLVLKEMDDGPPAESPLQGVPATSPISEGQYVRAIESETAPKRPEARPAEVRTDRKVEKITVQSVAGSPVTPEILEHRADNKPPQVALWIRLPEKGGGEKRHSASAESPSERPTARVQPDRGPKNVQAQSRPAPPMFASSTSQPGNQRALRIGLIGLLMIAIVASGAWWAARIRSSVDWPLETSSSDRNAAEPDLAPGLPPAAGSANPSGGTPPATVTKSENPPAVKEASPLQTRDADLTRVRDAGAALKTGASLKPSDTSASPVAPRSQPPPQAKTPRPELTPAQSAELKDTPLLAAFFVGCRDYDAAIKAYEEALRIDSVNRDAQARIARARQDRDAQKAEARL